MNAILHEIRFVLKRNADTKSIEGFQRFFKEKVLMYGLKTKMVHELADKYWKQISGLRKENIFNLCEQLLKSDYCEEAFIVALWLPRLAKQFIRQDIRTFRRWIALYINNWAKCDSFCNHTVGDLIMMYPDLTSHLMQWARAKNIWLKRAAAVSLIIPARRGLFLKEIFGIANILLTHEHDLVQKGYGWMLKEASRKHQKKVFHYVMEHKSVMPRTALRYAIELMPKTLKARAMS